MGLDQPWYGHWPRVAFTRLDDGIRLIDGQLDASFDGDIFRLDSLTFPARPRVEPQEWRTATWLKESPDAKDGKLTVSGQWNLSTQQGRLASIFSASRFCSVRIATP